MRLEPDDRQIRGACPLDCPDTCSWIVTLRRGEAVAAAGTHTPLRPRIALRQGRRLSELDALTRSPLAPCAGLGRRGAATSFVSPGRKLETIATELGDVIAKHGAEAIWPYVGCGSMGLIQGIYGAGAQAVERARRVPCRVHNVHDRGGFATGYTLGDTRVGMDPETFRFSKLVLLWGRTCCQRIPVCRRPILEPRKNGAAVVCIDPIRTRTAAASRLAPRRSPERMPHSPSACCMSC